MMFREVLAEDQEKNRNKRYSPFPLINAVIGGVQKGSIFRDDRNGEFIYHKAGFSWLNPTAETNFEKLPAFFINAGKLPVYFHIYDACDELIRACEDQKNFLNIRKRERVQLQFELTHSSFPDISPSPDFYIAKIDKNNFQSLSVFNLALESKFWNAEADFLDSGYGFCAFTRDHLPASICYSASVVNGLAEIDVATLPEYRNKGLAKKAVGAFIRYSIEHDIVPNWDCFAENTASLKTAKSLHFIETTRYLFLSIYNKSRENENI